MKKILLSAFAALALCIVVGCGKGEISAPAEETPEVSAESKAKAMDTMKFPKGMSEEQKNKMKEGMKKAFAK